MFKHLVAAIPALVFGPLLSSNAAAQCVPGSYWGLEEIYSNADGSVQFLVITSVAAVGEDAPPLAGTTLVAGNGATENAYTFPSDLPSRKNGQFILVGTQGFADLDLVKPDFIVPNAFVFAQNGSVSFSTPWCGGRIEYAALPADGLNAYFPDVFGDSGVYTGPAWASNFARESYTFTANYGGLWWKAPAGSESGWGIAVEHQRDIVFAAWATYDTDGSPIWFVMTGKADRGTEPITFQGTLYKTTGPAFDVLPFDPSAVTTTRVGTGEFQFSSTGVSAFSYTFSSRTNGGLHSATHEITRQIFAAPVPVCQIVATSRPLPNYQGLWWNAPAGSEAGWGLHLTHQGDVVFALWFTYNAGGKALWLAMAANRTGPNTYAGTVFRTTGPAYSENTFDPSMVMGTPAGTGTLAFDDASNGVFSYVADGLGTTQTKHITRQIFATPPAVCN